MRPQQTIDTAALSEAEARQSGSNNGADDEAKAPD